MQLKHYVYKFLPFLIFIVIALAYFPSILGGKSIFQYDIMNYKGSAKEVLDFEKETGVQSYWTPSMFSGMPTFQNGAKYDYDLLKKIDSFFRFLPRPADYLFLLLSGFYILLLSLRFDWKKAMVGSLFFAFSTYFFVILSAGHNAKVHTIAYIPAAVAGILLLYSGRYALGFFISMLFMGLLFFANHPQMAYYTGLMLFIFTLLTFIWAIRKGKIKAFLYGTALAGFAVFIALGLNAARLMGTYQYTKHSTRGQSELTLKQAETTSDGLDKNYITHWSYGPLETLNLLIPNFMGGATQSSIKDKAHTQVVLERFTNQPEVINSVLKGIPLYWGMQPSTAGPAYQGIVVVFFFFIGLFLVPGRYKWWLALSTLLSILLAWGKNLMPLTDFFIDNVPFYNKFRAVSSILIISEFCMPLLAMLMIAQFIKKQESKTFQKYLLYLSLGFIGFLALFYAFAPFILSFSAPGDAQLVAFFQGQKLDGESVIEAVKQDRITLFRKDTLRAMVFAVLSLGSMQLYRYKKINKTFLLLMIGALSLLDLWVVNKRYLNEDHFIAKRFVEDPFPLSAPQSFYKQAESNPNLYTLIMQVPVNKALYDLKQKDTGQYRVFNTVLSPMNEATTSYFHHSIGGYHGAKIKRYQEVFNLHMTQKINPEILSMLNAKYIMVEDPQSGQIAPMLNDKANGNAWFVERLLSASNANTEILSLDTLKTKQNAIIDKRFSKITEPKNYQKDSLSSIKVTDYKPNAITYKSENKHDGLAVFSEIYYPGWQAYIDGKAVAHARANYILRALSIPKGTHEIRFVFDPEVVKIGTNIMLVFNVLFIVLSFFMIYILYKKFMFKKMNS